ncbi:hypothetical protein [Streptomyces mirabilis]|uniref:hypothetical protein n=1 Tax=Streptomyces mirabilis TaxID=68239 RepID=UPI003D9DC0F2
MRPGAGHGRARGRPLRGSGWPARIRPRSHAVEATLDAQFVVFNIQGHERPAEGWPAGAFGAQGTITPIESGYYQPRMRRVDGVWRIFHHTVLLDQPLVLPGE